MLRVRDELIPFRRNEDTPLAKMTLYFANRTTSACMSLFRKVGLMIFAVNSTEKQGALSQGVLVFLRGS